MVDRLAEIRRLYYETTAATIQEDLERAIDLLKEMRDEDERGRAAVFMEGLNEMRNEWRGRKGPRRRGRS
ncbi:MAG: hypothetical protein DMF85_10175 [Acidobacteria bacterium]|nr:MAG: hypothetical protein DMF85_10175 [Acidobacteriota bacterium]